MWLSIGFLELAVVAVALLTTAVLALLRSHSWRWSMVVAVCLAAATAVSPADPLSTLAISGVFFLFFCAGSYFSRRRLPAA